jgi:hypothetical protein
MCGDLVLLVYGAAAVADDLSVEQRGRLGLNLARVREVMELAVEMAEAEADAPVDAEAGESIRRRLRRKRA